jgi:hypothetical protein
LSFTIIHILPNSNMSETPSETFPHVASSIGISADTAPLAGFGGGRDGNIVVAPQPVQVQSMAPPITCALTPSSFVRTIDAHTALSSQPTFPYGVAIHPSVSTPGTAYPLCHDFIYACDRCGRAEWSSPSALRRHRQQCRGRVAVRCTGCLNMFVSRRALEGHVELEGCYAATH